LKQRRLRRHHGDELDVHVERQSCHVGHGPPARAINQRMKGDAFVRTSYGGLLPIGAVLFLQAPEK
jgi:hypothetical protein